TVHTFLEVLIPTKAGTLEIPPRTLQAQLLHSQPGARRRFGISDPLFDRFLFSRGYATRQVTVSTEPITLRVQPLPPPPLDVPYIPVGTVKVSAKADRTTLKQGESISYHLLLTGTANLRPLQLPEVDIEALGFKRYDEEPEVVTEVVGNKILFTKTFRMALIAQRSGELHLPVFRVPVFNPETEKYEIVTTPDRTVQVLPGETQEQLVVSGAPASMQAATAEPKKQQVRVLNEDLLPQHVGAMLLTSRSRLPGAVQLALLLVLPLLSYGLYRVLRRRTQVVDPRVERMRTAYPTALSALDAAQGEASTLESAERLRGALVAYVSDRSGRSAESLTTEEAGALLTSIGVGRDAVAAYTDCMKRLDAVIYSGGRTPLPADTARTARESIERIESSLATHPGVSSLAPLLLLGGVALFLGGSTNRAHAADPATPTLLAEKAQVAYEQGDYEAAREAYRKLIAAGFDNGHLLYNLANTEYRLNAYGSAIAHYRQALSELPANADVLANLQLTRKQAVDQLEQQGRGWFSWKGLLDIPYTLFTQFQLQVAFFVCYGAFLFLLSASAVLDQPLLRTAQLPLLFVAIYLAVLVFGTRPGRIGGRELALTPEQRSRNAAVVATDSAKVHSGDSNQFQVVFVLHDGAEVETRERRGDWVEVFLPNERRGWMLAKQLAFIDHNNVP
ncbi:MAG: BatD family protein, partial [Bdellovibrionales bacterium]|nr:BatD family protein [Bdellovibrionales bacterium]